MLKFKKEYFTDKFYKQFKNIHHLSLDGYIYCLCEFLEDLKSTNEDKEEYVNKEILNEPDRMLSLIKGYLLGDYEREIIQVDEIKSKKDNIVLLSLKSLYSDFKDIKYYEKGSLISIGGGIFKIINIKENELTLEDLDRKPIKKGDIVDVISFPNTKGIIKKDENIEYTPNGLFYLKSERNIKMKEKELKDIDEKIAELEMNKRWVENKYKF